MRVSRILTALLLGSSLIALAPEAAAADRGKIDVDVVNADVRNVLRLFADIGHVNLVLGDDVTGSVTVRFVNVAWETAMRSVLSVKGLAMERTGNIVLVQRAEAFASERAARISAHELCLATAPLHTQVIRLSYADAEQVAAMIRPTLTKRGRVMVDTRTNTIVVTDVSCD
ncbi:MAG TPA: secretin N-terminal domain-containing protein [Polyangiaceae bacterium]|nr:secretin N-terminal domain-containing protein [Polyangiaceae bacterium]